MNKIKSFFTENIGAAAIEYGLIAALIAVIIIGTVKIIGLKLSSDLNKITNHSVAEEVERMSKTSSS